MKVKFIYTKWLILVGAILLVWMIGVNGLGYFSPNAKSSVTNEYNLKGGHERNEEAPHIVKLSISSNEYNSTNQNGKNESLNQPFCSPLYAYKLIRSSLFDTEQASVLSQKLIWYTQSTYKLRLSPFWQPSIPIAHRKLII